MPPKGSVSVILLCHNQVRNLAAILRALRGQTLRPEEVILSDDRSSDGVEVVARRMGCRYVGTRAHHRGPANGLRALARQLGTEAARSELLLYLDGDMIPSRRLLKAGAERVRSSSGRLLLAARRRFRIANGGARIRKCPPDAATPGEARISFEQFTSDCFLVSQGAVFDVGGWDDHFEGWGEEDVEFALRLEQAGTELRVFDDQSAYAAHIDHPIDHAGNYRSLARNAAYFSQRHPHVAARRMRYWNSLDVYLQSYRRSWFRRLGTRQLGLGPLRARTFPG